MPLGEINEDLVRERKNCTFDTKELTNLIDGGVNETLERKKIENVILNAKELRDFIPEEYMSHKERYENVIRKVCLLTKIMKDHVKPRTDMDKFAPLNTYKATTAITKDISPFMLHMGMFIPTIIGQANEEQMNKWLNRALNMEIIGTYAQTELGHGTFIRGLETTATYDPQTEEFVLHSPTITAYKWWPGGLGHTANHCIVVAQLYTQGKNRGVHPFIVQIRDEETHMPLPGVSVGEIGPKMGFQTANNGFLGFKNFRIPRDAMLMKNAQVLKDGSFVRSPHDKLAYGTMVFARVIITNDAAFQLAMASTIAIRYSAVRHQSQIKTNEPERQILDYVTQQHKLFIALATSHAIRIAGRWLWGTYVASTNQMKAGNMEALPELHAVACCLKAVCTADSAAFVEKCRLACGGHGYMLSSNLPIIYGQATAANTYEGENTVLLLQTARFLVKAWEGASKGAVLPSTVAYLSEQEQKWENSPKGIIRGLQSAAAGRIKSAVEALHTNIKRGKAPEDAWNLVSVQLVSASEAHCRAVMCEAFWNEIQSLSNTISGNLLEVLAQLAELYLVYWALEKIGDLLLYSNISKDDVTLLRKRYEELLAKIRPNAVGLVDSFDLCDEILSSTLGAYDGRVYERLMEEALKSPLNAEPVNQSFHKYLKPFMQGKL